MLTSIINTKSSPKAPKIKGNRKERVCFQFRDKSFFFFLTKTLGIPKGAKSSIVSIPPRIIKSSKKIKRSFLAGYFDTDGGFRGNSLGFTTASKKLNEGVSAFLREFSIVHSSESWKNKKNGKYYHGIKIRKSEIDNFLNMFPLKNTEKLIRICSRFGAEVPEWPNGTV